MLTQDIILKKRNGGTLSREEIRALITGIVSNSVSDSQIAAFTMATWFRGMTNEETVSLTLAMRDSGDVLVWDDWERPIADKHSTGGVGDNVSLMLAPIAAACGLAVPMISGRGLGHTGGTLDKLESIPGYQIQPDSNLFRKIVKDVGCAIIGPTAALAPADKRIYAVRDVTSTVDSVALITSSILSKKLASGLETLVLDIKIGSGAFMTQLHEAEILARSMVDVANGAGVHTTALITDMNEPLADCAGNALEVAHCLKFLKGELAGTRIEQVVYSFATEMVISSGLETDRKSAWEKVNHAVHSGQALECFARMVSMLGGPHDFVERADDHLPKAPVIIPIPAVQSGYLSACQTRNVGLNVIALGGGRRISTDAIDYSVGFSNLKPVGSKIERGEPIGFVHARNHEDAHSAVAAISEAYRILETAQKATPVIIKEISSSSNSQAPGIHLSQ